MTCAAQFRTCLALRRAVGFLPSGWGAPSLYCGDGARRAAVVTSSCRAWQMG